MLSTPAWGVSYQQAFGCGVISRDDDRIWLSCGSQSGNKRVSLADLIVLGGCAAVEQAAKNAGHAVPVPFAPGRTDASQEQTDVESLAVLEPKHDGFINYLQTGQALPAEHLLVERPTC